MGCDIHICCEVRRMDVWYDATLYKVNRYYDPTHPESGEPMYVPKYIFEGRDYKLFSILAGVRNYGDVEPISEPRGLPYNVSASVKEQSDAWGIDGHSHSYLTLRELMEYQTAHRTVPYSGMISPEQRKLLEKHGISPETWCQYTNMPDYERCEWNEACSGLKTLIDDLKKLTADEFWLSYLDETRKEGGILQHADDVRIVFWFDN